LDKRFFDEGVEVGAKADARRWLSVDSVVAEGVLVT
jgi:hypothetical protein